MQVQIKVLLPLVITLALLVIAVFLITCRFYVWPYIRKKKTNSGHHQYSKLTSPRPARNRSHSKGQKNGSPEQPILTAATSVNKIEKMTPKKSIESSNTMKKFKKTGNQFDFVLSGGKRSDRNSNVLSPDEVFHYNDNLPLRSPSPSFVDESCYTDSGISVNSEEQQQQQQEQSNKLQSMRARFKSEPILNTYDADEPVSTTAKGEGGGGQKRRRFSTARHKTRPKALSVIAPAGGQIEFTMFYDTDDKSLIVNLVQIVDVYLKPESFVGVLDIYDKDKITERKKSTSVYLIRNNDNTLQLSEYAETGFLLYLTLLPKRNFSKHTAVVFGNQSAVFNEKFTIQGQAFEQLSQSYLAIHALCKFGRDGEPIVLGEVKVPLKRIQTLQLLPFMANLMGPEEEIELKSYLKPTMTDLGLLEIYLSFNPMAHTLIVKIIHANGLPKIGMTGSPNVSVKTSLYYCNLRVGKKTTSIQKRQRNPIFNETFEFQLSKDRISECDVLFEIRHHGPMYRSVIGYVIVGNSAGGEGTKQWRQLLDFSYHERQYKIMPKKPVGLS